MIFGCKRKKSELVALSSESQTSQCNWSVIPHIATRGHQCSCKEIYSQASTVIFVSTIYPNVSLMSIIPFISLFIRKRSDAHNSHTNTHSLFHHTYRSCFFSDAHPQCQEHQEFPERCCVNSHTKQATPGQEEWSK